MYSFIILIVIIIIGFLVCKRNYKNRASYINNNLLEYCYEVAIEFKKLNYDEQIKFKNSLNPKELDLLNAIITKSISLGKNLNILQSHMFHLESLMKKLKSYKNWAVIFFNSFNKHINIISHFIHKLNGNLKKGMIVWILKN